MNYKILMKVQENEEEYRDTWKSIKDLEAELDYMYMREPDDIMYICKLEKQINKLYEKLDTLTDENN